MHDDKEVGFKTCVVWRRNRHIETGMVSAWLQSVHKNKKYPYFYVATLSLFLQYQGYRYPVKIKKGLLVCNAGGAGARDRKDYNYD